MPGGATSNSDEIDRCTLKVPELQKIRRNALNHPDVQVFARRLVCCGGVSDVLFGCQVLQEETFCCRCTLDLNFSCVTSPHSILNALAEGDLFLYA